MEDTMATRPTSSSTDTFFQIFDAELRDPANLDLMVDAVALPCQHRVNEDTALQILGLPQQADHKCPTCRAPFVNFVVDTTIRSLARERQRLQQGNLPTNTSAGANTSPRQVVTSSTALQIAAAPSPVSITPPRAAAISSVQTAQTSNSTAPRPRIVGGMRQALYPATANPVPASNIAVSNPVDPLHAPISFDYGTLVLPSAAAPANNGGTYADITQDPRFIATMNEVFGQNMMAWQESMRPTPVPTYKENVKLAADGILDAVSRWMGIA